MSVLGHPLLVLRPVDEDTTNGVECDILLVGGGMGGVSVALILLVGLPTRKL